MAALQSPPVVAVAASAGGVEALARFVAALPADLPAAVLVVLHLPASGPSVLPSILDRAGPLPADHAEDGAPLVAGRIVVAPPARHLRVEDNHVAVQAGPRLNGHRPSADALFLSVAEHMGPRGAGVVLSGTMDDGAAGLRAIDLAGGLTLVQDPEEAAFAGMPRAALAETPAAAACGIDEIVLRLMRWARAVDDAPVGVGPTRDGRGVAVDDPVDEGTDEQDLGPAQELSALTCPECGGSLVVDRALGVERYRCRVGHTFSGEHLLLGKQDALEAALWAAVVALEERADLSRRIVRRMRHSGRPLRVAHYEDEAARLGEHIRLLRRVIDDLVQRGPMTQDGDDDGDGSTA